MNHAVDVVELRALSDHPRIAEADERLARLGQQRADVEVDLRLLQQKREREEAEAALRLDTGSKIPPAIKKQLYVWMELTVHTAQLCWVLDAAIERATAARDALLQEVLPRYWPSCRKRTEVLSQPSIAHSAMRRRRTSAS